MQMQVPLLEDWTVKIFVYTFHTKCRNLVYITYKAHLKVDWPPFKDNSCGGKLLLTGLT